LKALCRPDEVDLGDADDDVDPKAQDQNARALLSARKLNPDLMLDLYRLNCTRNKLSVTSEEDHCGDEPGGFARLTHIRHQYFCKIIYKILQIVLQKY